MEKAAEKILHNIIELAELLDEETLKNAADIPIMELAKSVSIKKSQPRKEHKSVGSIKIDMIREYENVGRKKFEL
ncbi:MAG: hypothetical protein ACREQW_03055 [Candidatus Binatia bacterium]